MIWNDEMGFIDILDPEMRAELARLQACLHSINEPGKSYRKYWPHG